jgi:hypothetical protein
MMLFIFFLTLDIILLAAILLLLLYIKKIKREDRNAKSSEVINEYPACTEGLFDEIHSEASQYGYSTTR